jgi:hypothetical protein
MEIRIVVFSGLLVMLPLLCFYYAHLRLGIVPFDGGADNIDGILVPGYLPSN